jgi:hypothetical protein
MGFSLSDIFFWQVAELVNPFSFFYFAVGLALVLAVGRYWYVFIEGKTFAMPVLDVSFVVYFLWAIFQQVLVAVVIHFSKLDHAVFQYPAAVLLFAVVFHFPNRRLTVATGMLGAFVYLGWYVLGFNSLIYTALLHTLGAKLYKGLGYEMRVWRFGIKYG